MMPMKYFAEMVCDRIAASKIYLKDKYTNSSPLEYYESHKDENQFEATTRHLLEVVLTMLFTDGEEATFEWLKETAKIKV